MDYGGELKYIDVSAFRTNDTKSVRFSREVTLPVYFGVCENKAAVSFSGSLTFDGEIFTLNGSGTASYNMPCARCLTPVSEDFDFQIEEKLTRAIDKTGEKTLIEDNKIDVGDVITLCLISEMPRKSICDENCEGLYHLINGLIKEGDI